MAASRQDLDKLHTLITKSYTDRIAQDLEDNIPTDAATLAGAVKFLKDNLVTVDPANADDLQELRDKFSDLAKARKQRVGSVVALVKADEKLAAEG